MIDNELIDGLDVISSKGHPWVHLAVQGIIVAQAFITIAMIFVILINIFSWLLVVSIKIFGWLLLAPISLAIILYGLYLIGKHCDKPSI